MQLKYAAEVLQVSKTTIYRYADSGKIGTTLLPSGKKDYNDNDIYALLPTDKKPQYNVTFARTVEVGDTLSLDKQNDELKAFCEDNNYQIDKAISGFCSMHTLTTKTNSIFQELISTLISGKVTNLIVTRLDRLGYTSFALIQSLASQCGAKIIVLHKEHSEKIDEAEVMSDIMTTLYRHKSEEYTRRQDLVRKALLDTYAEKSSNEKSNIATSNQYINEKLNNQFAIFIDDANDSDEDDTSLENSNEDSLDDNTNDTNLNDTDLDNSNEDVFNENSLDTSNKLTSNENESTEIPHSNFNIVANASEDDANE